MLQLKNITKTYETSNFRVNALDGIDISFRENEFAAVLGPSGSGKTTLLNIVGGLDQYTDGDLLINGKSTKQFTSKDWDTYRNHSVGFVFQSYNLIPHLSVLANVELALTLSGVSRKERRVRAKAALERVGLGDQLSKKPNQMSGGQMQRVAIARALVNNPDILLADEPTGALDSVTSIQIMDLLKEIASDRLVIMVTHNPDLAGTYANRIIKLKDGRVLEDSHPFDGADTGVKQAEKKKKSMSFWTALSLSLHNLMTKKTRTLLTSFAGSIGIFGIALILSLSNGIQLFINQVQEDTLSSYPLTIEAESVDLGKLMTTLMGDKKDEKKHDLDKVYSSSVMMDMMNSMSGSNVQTNNLKAFKEYLEKKDNGLAPYLSAVQYSYDLDMNIYTKDSNNAIVKSDVVELMSKMMSTMYHTDVDINSSSYAKTYASMYNVWEEMLPGSNGALTNDLLSEQYDMLYGSWPKSYDEVVLVVDKNNEISDLCLYSLGLKSGDEMIQQMTDSMNGKEVQDTQNSWNYKDICGQTFRLVLASDNYSYDAASGKYSDLTKTDSGLTYLYNNGIQLKISGIIRPSTRATSAMLSGAIGYTSALTDHVIAAANDSAVVKTQLADKTKDVLTGLPFAAKDQSSTTNAEKAAAIKTYFSGLSTANKAAKYTTLASTPTDDYITKAVEQALGSLTRAQLEDQMVQSYVAQMGMDESAVRDYLAKMTDDELFAAAKQAMGDQVKQQYAAAMQQQLGAMTTEQLAAALDGAVASADETTLASYYDKFSTEIYSSSTYDDNLKLLGYVDKASPSAINLYATTFANKDAISDAITNYNSTVEKADAITYTDYVGLIMSSVTTVLNVVSIVLIAFVGISLFVSSIMIGIITYISVLERTKEIGVLRSIGASKRDIRRVFNAETLIIGLAAGLIGIGVTLLICPIANVVIHSLSGLKSVNAVLPMAGGLILVAISMVLTLIAGLIPSGIAARKDPVEALRSE